MKTVLITGGSSGIGAKCAELFAAEGNNVAFTFNANKHGANETTSIIERNGGVASVHQIDLNKESSVKELIDTVYGKFGRIDVLINNAGRYVDGDEWNGTQDVWMNTLSQNLVSMMNVSKYCIPIFQKQQSGVMVNVSSRLGISGNYEELAYGAAKAGVINITQAYAKLLAPYGRANSVSPGAVNTGYWLTASEEELEKTLASKPLKRLIGTEEVANAIFYLASEKAATVTGQNWIINQQ